MRNTSILGKCLDNLVNFILKATMYFVLVLCGILVMLPNELHRDIINYWSLIAAILYFVVEKTKLSHKMVSAIKGRWKYPNGKTYHEKLWQFVLNNIIPIVSLGIAVCLISFFPEASFDSNGLTFFAMLFTLLMCSSNYSPSNM